MCDTDTLGVILTFVSVIGFAVGYWVRDIAGSWPDN